MLIILIQKFANNETGVHQRNLLLFSFFLSFHMYENFRTLALSKFDILCVFNCALWFIHVAVCLTTVPKPLPKQALHLVWPRASSFRWEYPLLSLRLSSSFLCLLSCLPVTSSPSFIFPSITCHRRQNVTNPVSLPFNPLLSLMLQCARDLNVLCRPKRSKALLL
jgi:hypothetical protein